LESIAKITPFVAAEFRVARPARVLFSAARRKDETARLSGNNRRLKQRFFPTRSVALFFRGAPASRGLVAVSRRIKFFFASTVIFRSPFDEKIQLHCSWVFIRQMAA
jgi:hypothetical protein